MSDPARPQGADSQREWERAWSERYETAPSRSPARKASRRRPLRDLLFASMVFAVTVSSIAVAQGGDPAVAPARGEGDAISLGERNPGSGESERETAIVADAGSGGLVLRPSNTAKGGRAVSATCDNDGTASEDGCAVYVNKGTGAAASFRTQGAVPFALRETNTGRVQFLNADMVDGRHASEFLARSDAGSFLGASSKAADSDALDGQDSSAFLGASAKAADADTLDGKDSTELLGSTAKAADAETIDGIDSLNVARLSGGVFSNGNPTNLGYTSARSPVASTGSYRIDFPAGSFKTSNSCKTPIPIAVSRSNTPVIVTIADGTATCNAVDGSGGFTVKTFDAAGAPVDAAIWFMVV